MGQVTTAKKLSHRKDIDGLRAVAVLMVVFYHLGIRYFPSGFIGVDIFFVISGYLITKHIYQSCLDQNFRFTHFYLKRIRRIIPVLLVVLLVTTLAALFFYVVNGFLGYSHALLASLTFLSNFFYAHVIHVGYFSTDAQVFPLLHTWSLAVEEQFYVFWPILILLMVKLKKHYMLFFTLTLAFISFAFFYHFVHSHPQQVYYSPFTRAYELLIGAIIVFIEEKYPCLPTKYFTKNIVHFLSFLALCCLIYGGMIHKGDYDNWKVLIPLGGAALIIYTGRMNKSFSSLILSNSVFVIIGLMSYSIYLWHWPIIAYLHYLNIPLSRSVKIYVILATFVLSFFSWYFVEQVFRFKIKMNFYKSLGIFVVIPIALAIVFMLWSTHANKMMSKDNKQLRMEKNTFWMPTWSKAHVVSSVCANNAVVPKAKYTHCVLGDLSQKKVSVLMVGDSHAQMSAGYMDLFCKQAHLKGTVVAYESHAFLPNKDQSADPYLFRVYKNPNHFSAAKIKWVYSDWAYNYYPALIQLMQQKKFKYVFNFYFYLDYLRPSTMAKVAQNMANAIEFEEQAGSIPVIVYDIPLLEYTLLRPRIPGYTLSDIANINSNLYGESVFEKMFPNLDIVKTEKSYSTDKKYYLAYKKIMHQIISKLQARFPNLVVWDIYDSILCDKKYCYFSYLDNHNNNVHSYYHDDLHFNYYGSTHFGQLYLRKYGNPIVALEKSAHS